MSTIQLLRKMVINMFRESYPMFRESYPMFRESYPMFRESYPMFRESYPMFREKRRENIMKIEFDLDFNDLEVEQQTIKYLEYIVNHRINVKKIVGSCKECL
jgi:hypothetical protein